MSMPNEKRSATSRNGESAVMLTEQGARSGRLIHQGMRGQPPPPAQQERVHKQVMTLARLALAPDADIARDYVLDAQARGYSVDGLCVDLLAPAARRLGDLWNDDRCSFVEVTVGTARLQGILHGLAPQFMLNTRPVSATPRLLLVPTPGEQHTFGLQMVAEFFRRDGWAVDGGIQPTMSGICHAVAGNRFDVLGLSLSSESLLDTCAELIRQVRDISVNPDLRVIVGGYLPMHRQDVASCVAADAVSVSATDAPRLARQLLTDSVIAA